MLDLELIYPILILTFIMLEAIYLVIISGTTVDTVPLIIFKIIMKSIISLIFLFKVIIAINLELPTFLIGGDIFCLILWILCTVSSFFVLMDAKDEETEKDFDAEEIDVVTDEIESK